MVIRSWSTEEIFIRLDQEFENFEVFFIEL